MLPPAAAPESVVKAIADIDASLDDVVNHGSDDELFIASYLQGHFAVIARQQEMESGATLTTLNDAILGSLNAAFENKELDDGDQQKVLSLWQRLLEQAQPAS